MSFGLFKKQKGPFEVICPNCSNRQKESPLAVSTICKSCQSYLKIENGIAVATENRATSESSPSIVKSSPDNSPQKEAPSSSKPPSPKEKKAPEQSPQAALKPRSKRKLPPRPKPPLLQEQQTKPNPESLNHRKKTKPGSGAHPVIGPVKVRPKPPQIAPEPEAKPKEKEDDIPFVVREAGPDDRMVLCFDCEVAHPTSKNSTSALCPKCGAYISLKDFEIKEDFNSRIKTRGTVFIHKKGIVSSSIIQCHNLTVEGEFTGAAECSGELTIRRHSRITGKVQCGKLRIEKRAKVEFLKGAEVKSCEIDGLVEGDIQCKGHLALHKKATLHGNIKVGTLSVDEGAKHVGQISMG